MMLIGREAEIAQLEDVLRGDKHSLVVISGGPGTGRSALLGEIRLRAEKLNWNVLPSAKEENAPIAFSVNRNTTEDEFHEQILSALVSERRDASAGTQPNAPYFQSVVPESSQKSDTGGKGVSVISAQSVGLPLHSNETKPESLSEESSIGSTTSRNRRSGGYGKTQPGTLILIDGYQPNERFESKFLKHCIPDLQETTSPVVIAVAGFPNDLDVLSDSADLTIALGELPMQATTEFFASLNAQLATKMKEEEIAAYASASAKDLGLINALSHILRLS